MNPINIDYDKCTGCMACRNICPTGAIKIKINSKGFEYPDIDKNICIHFLSDSYNLYHPYQFTFCQNDISAF